MSKDNWALIEQAIEKINLDDMFERLLDERLNRSYNVGISVGLDKAHHILLNKATCLFAAGQDELASRYRDLSRELKKLSEAAHPGVDK